MKKKEEDNIKEIENKRIEKFINKKKDLLKIDDMVEGILKNNRTILSQSITLLESKKKEHQDISKEIINRCLPYSGNSLRIGITGVPGVGKSTFIETFGNYLLNLNQKIAVMAVDPSSSISRGSLLGDKTRMETLAGNKNVFIRPSASGGYLGGVNRATRETIILCEAAGYDTILIETVGVGQSEIMVHSMVDFFLLLSLAGAGDEIQGMKKGIMEMADMIVITKADGDNINKTEIAKKEKETALHYSSVYDKDWTVPVLTCSSLENRGIGDIYKKIMEYIKIKKDNNKFYLNRQNQLEKWFTLLLQEALIDDFLNSDLIIEELVDLKNKIINKKISPVNASLKLIDLYKK